MGKNECSAGGNHNYQETKTLSGKKVTRCIKCGSSK